LSVRSLNLHAHIYSYLMYLYDYVLSLCHADHRDLHSFPTRRSSDLIAKWVLPTPGGPKNSTFSCLPMNVSPASSRMSRSSTPGRSEEHTSELQSRENLVCRLLLEKKNNTLMQSQRFELLHRPKQ